VEMNGNGTTSLNPHLGFNHNLNSHLKRPRSSAEKEESSDQDHEADRGQGKDQDLQEIKRRTIDIQNMLKTILSSQPHSQSQARFQSPSTLTSASALGPALPPSFGSSSVAIPDKYPSITSAWPPITTTTTHQNQSHSRNHHNHNHHTEESDLYGKTHPETGGPIGSSLLALGLASPPAYLDPIDLGVVLPREMERVYQV
jgi:hypothetical protein